jgi:hypothetical protein
LSVEEWGGDIGIQIVVMNVINDLKSYITFEVTK